MIQRDLSNTLLETRWLTPADDEAATAQRGLQSNAAVVARFAALFLDERGRHYVNSRYRRSRRSLFHCVGSAAGYWCLDAAANTRTTSGFTAGAICDLVSAAGSVSDYDGVVVCLSYTG